MSQKPSPANPPALGVRAVLVAAGRATRMGAGGGPRKPLIQLQGRPILEHTCARFEACALVTSIVIVTHREDVPEVQALREASPSMSKVYAVIPGGAERADSVRLGLAGRFEGVAELEPGFDLIAVHDAARPLVREEAITRCIESARQHAAALLAIPVRDTLKRSSDGRSAHETVDRAQLWAAQTPQIFQAEGLRACHDQAHAEGFLGTDDASLWERYRGPVQLVPGHWDNLKITEQRDLAIGDALLTAAQGG